MAARKSVDPSKLAWRVAPWLAYAGTPNERPVAWQVVRGCGEALEVRARYLIRRAADGALANERALAEAVRVTEALNQGTYA